MQPWLIHVLGAGGIGKSTALKYLAISWAGDTSKVLRKFDYVFHITLKQVHNDSALQNIIKQQHTLLAETEEEKIVEILNEKDMKSLLLLDGYDEYHREKNPDIDKIIEKRILGHCWLVLTTRPNEEVDEIKNYMDAVAKIEGFSSDQIKEYAKKFLEDEAKAEAMLSRAKDIGISELLKIPILLQMICVLYLDQDTLPNTKKGKV